MRCRQTGQAVVAYAQQTAAGTFASLTAVLRCFFSSVDSPFCRGTAADADVKRLCVSKSSTCSSSLLFMGKPATPHNHCIKTLTRCVNSSSSPPFRLWLAGSSADYTGRNALSQKTTTQCIHGDWDPAVHECIERVLSTCDVEMSKSPMRP